MAITVNIYYTGENESARKFAQEMVRTGTAGAIRAKKGNLRYDYFFSMDDPETVLLIDAWESQEALNRHHESLEMSQIIKLREKYDLHMKVERYLPDEQGMDAHDRAFIRE